MNSSYAIRSPLFLTNRSFGISFVRDVPFEKRKSTIDFHVASGDYFGTLATVVGLVADALSKDDATMRRRSVETLSELREDLVYLQDEYLIRRK